jgi:hypothetical protein
VRIGSIRRIAVETIPLLAALAAIALLVDGDAVQAVSAVVVLLWALWMVVVRRPRVAGEEDVSWPMLLLRILPIVVAGAIAESLASDRWFPFTFVALAAALVIPWAAALRAWERRRAPHEPS